MFRIGPAKTDAEYLLRSCSVIIKYFERKILAPRIGISKVLIIIAAYRGGGGGGAEIDDVRPLRFAQVVVRRIVAAGQRCAPLFRRIVTITVVITCKTV